MTDDAVHNDGAELTSDQLEYYREFTRREVFDLVTTGQFTRREFVLWCRACRIDPTPGEGGAT